MINQICNKFKEAIEHIMEQNVIAVTFHGIDSGRDGILSQMEVATECAVIVFDILNLKEKAFVEGLKDVFECERSQRLFMIADG